MSGLYSPPVKSAPAATIIANAAVALAILVTLGLAWWSFSPILGRIYAILRLIETGWLWKFTSWGAYFTGMPPGRPFAFVSVYKSSLGFGVVFSLGLAIVAALAYRARARQHLVPNLAIMAKGPRKDAPKPASAGKRASAVEKVWGALRRKAVKPAPTQEKDDAKTQPQRKEEPVYKAETIFADRFHSKAVMPGAMNPEPPLPTDRESIANPFHGLRDLRDGQAVSAAQPLPWPHAAVLALLIEAAVPPTTGGRREAILRDARETAAATYAGKAEPARGAALHDVLTATITSMSGREQSRMDEVHDILHAHENIADTIQPLVSLALTRGRIVVADFAWLSGVNTDLHTTVVAF